MLGTKTHSQVKHSLGNKHNNIVSHSVGNKDAIKNKTSTIQHQQPFHESIINYSNSRSSHNQPLGLKR